MSDLFAAIRASGLTIYDSLQAQLDLFIADEDLERILNAGLRGLVLNQPLRTRSKVLKSKVCEVLGYPIPSAFKKTQPRFPGQNFDTYVQKSNNLQIWNEEVSPSRRYVLIRVDDKDRVTKVRVVTGPIIAAYDTTGTLTHKYQARSKATVTASRLVSPKDTENVKKRILRTKLPEWSDNGQFPDIKEQLLEIKLQTSPTIDLGLVCPDSTERIADLPGFRHCEVRYAVFYALIGGNKVRLNHVILSTGSEFFRFFDQFGGLVTNKKLQIPLPRDFFG